ncbi:MAG: hypothetical protein JNK25_01735 [Phycisphaerae bacterium]|nr:hypothetical protein [Phycisphaerae bacterium]
MKSPLVFALLAGAAASSLGQVAVDPATETATSVVIGNPGYGARLSPVWSNARFPGPVNATTYASLWDIFDDIDFSGGPWQGATGRVITQMNWGLGQAAVGTPGATIAFRFYDATAVEAAGGGFENATDMTAGVLPFATQLFNVASTYSGSAIFTWYTAGANVAIPDGIDRVYVRATIHNQNDTNTVWTGAAEAFRWRLANDLTVGSGTTNIALNTFNVNTPPYFTGNPNPGRGFGVATDPGTTQEHRNLAFPPSVGTPPAAANGKGIWMILSGEVVIPDPAGTIDLGNLDQDCENITVTLAPGETKFYKFTTLDDATRALGKFLDLDTEGSTVNASMAIWQANGTGNIIRSDAADGSGDNAQLTFGLGNRAPVGDGRCYDGRDGNTMLAGSYIVGITTGDATFGSGFFVSGAGTGGDVSLNICSNTNGSPLGDSVRPCLVDASFDLGNLAAMTSAPPAANMENGNVVWYRFEVCPGVADDGDNSASGPYVDFAFNRSFPGSDTDCILFNDAGDIIAEDNDSGPGAFSQLSFGDVSPARPPFGDGLPFEGQNGSLEVGVYWLGVGLFDVQGFDGRWAAYSTSGSGLPANFDVYQSGLAETCCPPCAADFNQDGGVDGADVEAFYTIWETGAGCGDVNQDGGVDGGDVEAFFGQWEAGGC